MEYRKNEDNTFSLLPQKNVDFGGGLERMVMAVNNLPDIIQANHKPIIEYIEKASSKIYGKNPEETKSFRIIADHIKASVFLIGDGVNPSNTDKGYFVRRLLRRAILNWDKLGIENKGLSNLIDSVLESYKDAYVDTYEKKEFIKQEVDKEEVKFRETLKHGLKEFERGIDPFVLFTTYGFPIELTEELAKEQGKEIDLEDFHKKMAEHQKLSQTASAGMFKGGLANHNEKTVRLHTAHHLLLAGLQEIVSKEVKQRGSNITEERLRIDFLCDHKLTDEEKQKVEAWVNDKISQGLPVTRTEMPLAEAQRLGAEMEFGAKYPEMVSVYFIGGNGHIEEAISKEFCGGPHVQNTKELGQFKILKEEAVSAGVRRIKAVLL
jgi:alanyl-tRNA synthetase